MGGAPAGLAGIVAALVLGWLVARWLLGGAWAGPRWSSTLIQISLGTLFGPGIVSLACFLLLAAGIANSATVWGAQAVLIAGAGALAFRPGQRKAPLSAPTGSWPWNWVLVIAVALGLAALLAAFYATSSVNFDGDWDAFSIWNVRARYLAGGEATWRRAFGAEVGGRMVGASHPGYPLLLSAFVAAEWIAGGAVTSAVNIAASLLFALAVLGALVSSIGLRRGTALGLLAGLAFLSTDTFVAQAPGQYADLPAALCFLASLVLWESAVSSHSKRLFAAAGFAAGLAPWTKNEGWPFLIAFLAVAIWRARGAALWTVVGSLPGVVATIAMKVWLVTGTEAMFPTTGRQAVSFLAQPARWWAIAQAFAHGLWQLGALPWAHPILLVAAVVFVAGVIPRPERATRAWLLIPIAAVFAADYGIFVLSTADLTWHLGTSVDRLILQMWPSLLFVAFLMLQPLEDVKPNTGASAARGSRARPGHGAKVAADKAVSPRTRA
jgi:hypothetical protein